MCLKQGDFLFEGVNMPQGSTRCSQQRDVMKTKVLRVLFFGLLLSTAAIRAFAGPGAVDPTFNVVVNNAVYSVLTQPDGKILIGGAFTPVCGPTPSGLARRRPDRAV